MSNKDTTAAQQAQELNEALGATLIAVKLPTLNKEIYVAPLRVKQFSEVLKCVNQLAEQLGISLNSGMEAAQLLMTGGDVAIRLIAIASGLEIPEIEKLQLDEAAELAGAIWSVNKSFFEKKAVTMLAAFGMSQEKAAELWDGLKSSLSSSVTATATQTSPNTP